MAAYRDTVAQKGQKNAKATTQQHNPQWKLC